MLSRQSLGAAGVQKQRRGYVCREGKIYEHAVDNVVLRDPPMGISPLWTNLQRILNPQPQPCPGAMPNPQLADICCLILPPVPAAI